MDYLNSTFPCGDKCPLSFAKPVSLFFTENKEAIILSFNAPLINTEVQVLEADPFFLKYPENNKTCTIKYTAPQSLIVRKEGECIHSISKDKPKEQTYIVASTSGCIQKTDRQAKFYSIENCHAESS